ncbi:MAG: rhodanese-like domain-containing protein [Steroidobacteraceae bacterium]
MSTRTNTAFMTCIWILACAATPAMAEHKPAASIPAADLIQPADFAAALKQSNTLKPLILQVGFRNAYAQAHIPDAEYVGAAGDENGLKTLQKRVAKLPTDSAIVIYCGCCPWSRCPNIAAAYDALHDLGFNNVKVLEFADDFGTNWVDKGYPTTNGT